MELEGSRLDLAGEGAVLDPEHAHGVGLGTCDAADVAVAVDRRGAAAVFDGADEAAGEGAEDAGLLVVADDNAFLDDAVFNVGRVR